MTQNELATRRFGPEDQARFARMTGDFNPVHMDPVAARRTQPGAPVVHGIHVLLWMLDTIAHHLPGLPPIVTLRTRFLRFIYVDDAAVLVHRRDAHSLTDEIWVGGNLALRTHIGFTPPDPVRPASPLHGQPWISPGDSALGPTLEEMASLSGQLSMAQPTQEIADAFPAAHSLVGGRRVAALGACSRLVGMICPGLHSVFAGLHLMVCDDCNHTPALAFAVTAVQPRLRVVREAVYGGGLTGTLESFVRPPPVRQSAMESIGSVVDADEFVGASALIVGGSRGLGEVTAKLITAGGGRVTITYASGRSDAQAVAAEINAWGGDATILHYDVLRDPGTQLAHLKADPTHLYYFATPPIRRGNTGTFDDGNFQEFISYYIEGFYSLCEALARGGKSFSVYYPSSSFVENTPGGLLEYAMAKVAGEVLCARMPAILNTIAVVTTRLPPLLTDQTAGLLGSKAGDPVSTMLPVVRAVQGRKVPTAV
jgi:MaoC like domain/short chain dehydrogenase